MHRRPRLLISSVLLSIVLQTGVALTEQDRGSQPAAPAPDVTRLGPQVGDKVPDFTLPDQGGRRRSLSSLMGKKGLVLVFSRSADW
jgi:cytochrome oxidase Cu insertion factor (SCO1/SenC/PrrC family)